MSNEINSTKCLKLERMEGSCSYKSKGSTDCPLCVLADFLLDVGKDAKQWKKWFLEEVDTSTGTTTSSVIKDEKKNEVYIWDDFDNEVELMGEQFIAILDRWDELRREAPKEIAIFRKDNNFILESYSEEH